MFARRKGDKGRVGGQSLSPKCERLPSVQWVGESDRTRAGEARLLLGCAGLCKALLGFAGLPCRIGVIPSEGVAINLVHYVGIISVRLLQKLTVACVLILFKRKYKNKCSTVKYKCLLEFLLLGISHSSIDSSPVYLLGCLWVSVLGKM